MKTITRQVEVTVEVTPEELGELFANAGNEEQIRALIAMAEAVPVGDFPPIGSSSWDSRGASFSISCDADPEFPEVNIHAHRAGIGGLFPLSTKDARALAVQLINAADAVDREVNAAKTKAA